MKTPKLPTQFLIATAFIGTAMAAITHAQDPEAKAYAQKLVQVQESCDIIGERIDKCYSGQPSECDTVTNVSMPWFQNEYGALPDTVCPLAANGKLFTKRTL